MNRLARQAWLWAAMAVLAVVSSGCRSVPDGVNADQYNYFTNCDTIAITRYTGGSKAVTIPWSVSGLPVTSIGNVAFRGCTNLTSVMIPDSVTNIGRLAFSDCNSLTGVYFKGNAPCLEDGRFFASFARANRATIYHLPETTGWSNSFGGRPTAIWNPQTNALGNTQSK